MRVLPQIFLTASVAAALAMGWLWLEGQGESAKSASDPSREITAPLVLVEPLYLQEDKLVVQAIGTGEALRSAALYPAVEGEVQEVYFQADQKVSAGAPLLRLEDRHERLAVRLAEVAAKETKRQLARLEKLVPSGAVAMARFETAQAEYESAALRLDQARADLDDRTVTAPFEGMIGLTRIDKGDRVTEDTLLAILDDRSVIHVEFDLAEDYVKHIAVGDPVELRPWTDRRLRLAGTISAIDSRIDTATRSLRVEAELANDDDLIKPGMSFEVLLDFSGERYPAVREVAVLWSRDGAYLWRIAGDRTEKVFVAIVRRNEGEILVDGPLEAGDMIVVEGVQGLRDNQQVEVAPYAGAPAAQPTLSTAGQEPKQAESD